MSHATPAADRGLPMTDGYRPPPGWEAAASLQEELFLRRVVEVLDRRLEEMEARTRAESIALRQETEQRIDAWKSRWRRRLGGGLAFIGAVNLAGAWKAYTYVTTQGAALRAEAARVHLLSDSVAAFQASAKHDVEDIQSHLREAAEQAEGARRERQDQERATIDMMNGLSSAYRDMVSSSQAGVQSALNRTADLTRSVDTLSHHLGDTRVASGHVLDSMRTLGNSIAANVDSLRGQVQGVWNVVLRQQPGVWQRIGLSGLEANVRVIHRGGKRVSMQIREPNVSASSIWETTELSYAGPDSVRWKCFWGKRHRYALGILWGIKQHQSIVFWKPNPYPDLVQVQLAVADGEPPPGAEAPHCPR
ncbi:hypothetical protein J421_0992 [Gemmatirosa kalamazoonensis]|uniref:Uncharacterized protein n=1 Tax=Gemmatirosa kalamazoonensis TaxID=861299 RepID=W0RBP2_9BACT|nr:hypothetical protein [Gemmatirosa kalamazoonensis]AHG88529.1 hypothetical protein J421_0992 [Gemmatirosa kalamazoonensis]